MPGDAIRELPATLQTYVGELLPYTLPAVGSLAIVVTLYLLAARLIRRAGSWT